MRQNQLIFAFLSEVLTSSSSSSEPEKQGSNVVFEREFKASAPPLDLEWRFVHHRAPPPAQLNTGLWVC